MVDARDLKSLSKNGVWVRIPSSAPTKSTAYELTTIWRIIIDYHVRAVSAQLPAGAFWMFLATCLAATRKMIHGHG
jgi:hypothetical protein